MKQKSFKNVAMFLSIIFIILIILFIFLLTDFKSKNLTNNQLNITQEKLILGYCPTMKERAINIKNLNSNIELKEYRSSLEVLNDLNQKKIDIALVGRVAKSYELNINYFEKRLAKGFTLVYKNKEKSFILSTKLNDIKIHTYLLKEDIKYLFQNTNNFVFYDDKISTINNAQNEPILIDWDDFVDEYNLLIPIDMNNNKIKEFRIPILYSSSDLNNIKI